MVPLEGPGSTAEGQGNRRKPNLCNLRAELPSQLATSSSQFQPVPKQPPTPTNKRPLMVYENTTRELLHNLWADTTQSTINFPNCHATGHDKHRSKGHLGGGRPPPSHNSLPLSTLRERTSAVRAGFDDDGPGVTVFSVTWCAWQAFWFCGGSAQGGWLVWFWQFG